MSYSFSVFPFTIRTQTHIDQESGTIVGSQSITSLKAYRAAPNFEGDVSKMRLELNIEVKARRRASRGQTIGANYNCRALENSIHRCMKCCSDKEHADSNPGTLQES